MSQLTTQDLIKRLEDWRNADQEDAITLPRSHLIMLLEAAKAPGSTDAIKAIVQNEIKLAFELFNLKLKSVLMRAE